MSQLTYFQQKPGKPEQDNIRIVPDKEGVTYEVALTVVKMIDGDTQQHIVFLPTLDITGYGETIEKADAMAKESVGDFFDWLMELNNKNRMLELQKLGWKQNAFANKNFSKAFVDMDGVLQNFNVKEATISRLDFATH